MTDKVNIWDLNLGFHSAKVAAHTRYHQVIDDLMGVLPGDLPYAEKVFFFDSIGTPHITLEVQNREEAVVVYEQASANVLGLAYVKRSGFSSIKPVIYLKPADMDCIAVQDPDMLPVTWRHNPDSASGGLARCDLRWWTMEAGHVVSWTMQIHHDGSWQERTAPLRRLDKADWVTRDFPNGERVRWYTPGGEVPHLYEVWFPRFNTEKLIDYLIGE